MEYKQEIPEYASDAFSARKNDYCVCVFVINEGERLHKQLEKMRDVCAGVADIVVADGGSTDGSTEHDYLKSQNVRALLVKKSVGKLGTQMRMAFDWALKEGYQGVVVVDGNGKDGIDAIPRFVEELKNGVDHVQGSRFIPGGHHENTPLSRLLGVKLLHSPLMTIASGFRYTDTTNGFRAYSRKLLESPDVDVFRECFSGYELHYYLAIEAARLGFKVKEIPVSRVYPAKGKTPTKISFFKGNFGVLERLFTVCRGEYSHRKTMWSRLTNLTGGQSLFAASFVALTILIGVCVGVWDSHSSFRETGVYKYALGMQHKPLTGLRQGVKYSQTFSVNHDGFNSLEVRMAAFGRKNHCTVNVTLKDASNQNVVVSQKIPAEIIKDNAYRAINFPAIKDSKGKSYVLELQGSDYASPKDAITIWSIPSFTIPSALVNGKPAYGAMLMAFSYSDVNGTAYSSRILHIELLALLGLFCMYALLLLCIRKNITSDSWEKYLYPLLFLAGIGILMARATSLIATPDLYTEDATWSGSIMTRGFWHTFLYARQDYFVSGNILFLGIGLLINKAVFGCNMFFYPIILTFLQLIFYTLTALLPVVLFRKSIGLFFRLVIFASFMLLSGDSVGLCNYEIFGKISNIGFLFLFISFCILMHMYNNGVNMGVLHLGSLILCIQICYMTNPTTYVAVFMFWCMNLLSIASPIFNFRCDRELVDCRVSLRPVEYVKKILRDKFFWISSLLGVMAVMTLLAGKFLLPGKVVQHASSVEVTYGRIVETVSRAFYPILALFYHNLTEVSATVTLMLIGVVMIFTLVLRRKDKVFLMMILGAVVYLGISIVFRTRETVAWASEYCRSYPLRYCYGVTAFIYVAYCMAMEALFKRKDAACKFVGLLMLGVLSASLCVPNNKVVCSNFSELERYCSSFFDHKDIKGEIVAVNVPPTSDDKWILQMPYNNFKATYDFMMKNADSLRIPKPECMFFKQNHYWKNCINRSRAAFYVRNTEENRKKFRKGCKIVLPPPYGERIIEGVREDRIFFDVYISGSRLATDKVIDFEKWVDYRLKCHRVSGI